MSHPLKETDRRRVMDSLERGRPLGRDPSARRIAERLALQYTLNARGRPKKPAPEAKK